MAKHSLKVLLIDDNPDDRALALRELRREFAGLRVDQVSDAKAYRQILKSFNYGLVITDYDLGWSNGLEVLHAVKRLAPDCPVIMFTGSGSEQIAVEAMKAGLSDYVLKDPEHLARLGVAARRALHDMQQRQALREAQAHYRDLFEGVPVGLCRITPGGKFLEANPAMVRLCGCPDLKSLFLRNIADFIAATGDQKRWRALMKSGEDISNAEIQGRRLDGADIWIRINAHAVRDDNGKILHYEAVVKDITEARRREEGMRQNDERFQLISRAVNDVIWDWDLAHDKLWWNENFQSMFGYRRREIEPGIESWTNRLHPEDKDRVLATIHGVIDRGGHFWKAEYRFRRRDGSYADIFDRGYVIRDDQGKPVRMVGAMMDFTERKRSEEALRLNEARLRQAQRIGRIGSWEADVARNTLVWSEETYRIFGRDPSTFSPTHEAFFAAVHPDDLPAVRRASEESLRTGKRYAVDHRLVLPDGTVRTVHEEAEIICNERGEVQAMVGTTQDITERKHAEEALRQSEQLLKTVLETLPVGVWVTDAAGKIVMGNPAGQRIWAGARMVGIDQYGEYKGWWADSGERIAPEEWALARAVRRGETSLNELVDIECFDGTRKTILNSAVPILDAAGKITGAIVVNQDITERRRAEEALRDSEAHLRAIIDTEPECVKLLDAHGKLLQMNAAGLAMIEADSAAQVIGRPVLQLVAAGHREAFRAFSESVVRGSKGTFEFEIIGFKGTHRWLESHAVPLKSQADGSTLLLSVTRDITEQKRNEERLSFLAHYDSLTGLPNRTLFNDRLQQAMIEAHRHDRLVGVIFLDLDRFKNINDSLGHDIGDMLLKGVAERLNGAVRKGDTVARLSGDEFTLVLADMGHVDDALRVAQKIIEVFEQPFHVLDRELHVTASLGITLFPFDDRDINGLLRNADVAMYRAKEAGRNTYQFYAAEMTSMAQEHLALENDLRHVLERDELFIEYQPIVDCSRGNITGVEALLRWQHGKRGLIMPNQFIPLAEETGLIVSIGEWVLRKACAQCRDWHKNGHADLRLTVNLSPRQFQQPKLPEIIERILLETGLDPEFLELEITESILIHKSETTISTLRKLNQMKVGLAIDDFGTGYSSLSYLKRFPIDVLKIDQSFVRDIPADADDAAIATAIISMAHNLGIRVIAEGVETKEQLTFMREHRCDALQGYYFSRPASPDAISGMLRDKKRLQFDT